MKLLELCVSKFFLINQRIRCIDTQRQYQYALANLEAFVGHPPELTDLNDDNVAGMMGLLARRGLSVETINDRRGRINSLWTWCAKRGMVTTWPTVSPLPEPERIPLAWSRDDVAAILRECSVEGGWVAGIAARLWWETIHLVMWDSGERIGALMAARWSHLQGENLILPAEIRKGGQRDRIYRLHQDTVAKLESIRKPERELIWPWDRTEAILYRRYKNLLKRAGLPFDRKSMFHRMRRSVASHYEAAGGNATELLGHSNRRTTQASYIDPRISPSPQAVDRLFRPAG